MPLRDGADIIRRIDTAMTATLELMEIGDSLPWLEAHGLLNRPDIEKQGD